MGDLEPRYTDETVELLAATWFRGVEPEFTGKTWDFVRPSVRDAYRKLSDLGLKALADAGLLVKSGGVSTQIWRVRNIDSYGSVICHTLKDAERWLRHEPNNPWQGEDSPRVLEEAVKTEWPDGSVYTGSWKEVPPVTSQGDVVDAYRNRMRISDAVRWNGSNCPEVFDLAGMKHEPHDEDLDEIVIQTELGDVTMMTGDWLVKTAEGKLFVYKDTVFREEYEA